MEKTAVTDAINYLDDLFSYEIPVLDTPSVSIAIHYQGKIVYQKAFGEANLESHTPATPETSYRVASNSKIFTAVAFMQLQERGVLNIDDTVSKYVPWLNDHTDTRWRDVSIRALLSHNAGISRDSTRSGYWGMQYEFPDAEQLKQTILSEELVYDPYTTMKYSNYGYGLLGLVLEAAVGMPYSAYITKHIVKPLNLKDTHPEYNQSDTSATGYVHLARDDRFVPIDPINTRALTPATGISSTPGDICRLLADLVSDSPKLLSKTSIREMTRRHTKIKYGSGPTQYYGLGLDIGNIDGSETISHGGGFPGQLTSSIAIPDEKLVVSVVTNSRQFRPYRISQSIINALHWFSDNYTKKPKHDLTKFTVRTRFMWGATETIGYGNSIVSLPTAFPLNFDTAERLVRINDTTLKTINTSSLASPGETMAYVFNSDGTVNHIVEQGAVHLPAHIQDRQWSTIDKFTIETLTSDVAPDKIS